MFVQLFIYNFETQRQTWVRCWRVLSPSGSWWSQWRWSECWYTWVYPRGLLVMLKELLAGIWSSLQPPWPIAEHWKCCNEWRPSYSSQHIRCMMNASHAYSGIVHAAIFIFGPLGRLRSGCSNTSQMFLTADGVFGLDFWLSWEVKPESNLGRDP